MNSKRDVSNNNPNPPWCESPRTKSQTLNPTALVRIPSHQTYSNPTALVRVPSRQTYTALVRVPSHQTYSNLQCFLYKLPFPVCKNASSEISSCLMKPCWGKVPRATISTTAATLAAVVQLMARQVLPLCSMGW